MTTFIKQYKIAKQLAAEANDAPQEIELVLECVIDHITVEATIVPYLDAGIDHNELLAIVDEHAREKIEELMDEGLNLLPYTWCFNEECYDVG